MRKFDTGASRNSAEGKLDYEGYLSPLVLRRYAEYMAEHQKLPDGSTRASDNWQLGMPRAEYMKSLWRHLMGAWSCHRQYSSNDIEELLCAIIFNASGYLHEQIKERIRCTDPEGDEFLEWLASNVPVTPADDPDLDALFI